MLGVNTLTNNYRSTTWVSTLLASKDMGPYKYLYVNTHTAIRLHPTISSYTVKVTDKNPAIKLCVDISSPPSLGKLILLLVVQEVNNYKRLHHLLNKKKCIPFSV